MRTNTSMKALVLAGGTGSRLRPLTHTAAKQLIPIANKPIIYYGLEDIAAAGIKEVTVIIGKETAADIRKELGDGSRWGLNLTFIYQDEPLGLAHCLILAEEFLGNDPFVMYLGDNLLKGGIADFARAFQKGDADSLVLVSEVSNPGEFGVAEFNADGTLKRLVEKPQSPPSNMALVGIYFFNHHIFEAVGQIKPSWRNELEITDAIQWLLDHGRNVDHREVQGWWKDTGKPGDVLEANCLILQDLTSYVAATSNIDTASHTIGEVRMEEDVLIKNSVVRGPIIIGKGTRIENSAVGPYTSIGAQCEIRNAEISYSIVMEGAKIKDLSVKLDWSLIGREVEIYRVNGMPKGINMVLGDRSRVGLV